jgi:hypothetical protein
MIGLTKSVPFRASLGEGAQYGTFSDFFFPKQETIL